MFQPRIHAAPSLLTRLMIRFSLPSILLFTIVILFVHGQQASQSNVALVLLPPPGCSSPCFMGIKPGVTTLEAGLAHLRSSPLIKSISPASSSPSSPIPMGTYEVEFAPTTGLLQTAKMQFITQARSHVIEGIIVLDTDLRLSDVALTFGQPASLILDDQFHVGLATYVAFYPQYQVYVQTVLAVCSPQISLLGDEREDLVVGFETPQRYNEQRGYYPNSTNANNTGWAQQLYNLKRTNCV